LKPINLDGQPGSLLWLKWTLRHLAHTFSPFYFINRLSMLSEPRK
jgi:hypothetical protein